MPIQGFDPNLHVKTGGYSIHSPSENPPKKVYGGGGLSSDNLSSAAPEKESSGFLTKLWENVQWMISEIHDLVFSCFGEEVEIKEDKQEEIREQVRDEWIPVILDKWFSPSLKLGNHIKPKPLIKDLQKLPDPIFKALVYGFSAELLDDDMTEEDFVNKIVMRKESGDVQESLVLERLKKLSPEEVTELCNAFFESQEQKNPGPITVEVFVNQYVMKLKLGLHAGHLIEDLQVLPPETCQAIIQSFFQGIEAPPNYYNLSVDVFVKEHIVGKAGALSRLKAVLTFQSV